MANTKTEIIKMIKRMPDSASVSDIIAELYFRQKVDLGLKQLDEGKSISHQKAKTKLKKWLS